jgi:dTDP-4-amino-4,6-dideoxygalactose transaminase
METPAVPDAPLLLSPPEIGEAERQYMLAALDSGWVAPAGPDLAAFEHEFGEAVDVPHVVALSSGTAGLHLSLRVLGVEPGRDVLVSDLTFVATANAVAYVGARPCFVDSDERTWNIDPSLLADELRGRARRGRLPAAVIAVDLYGQCADYDRIAALCRDYDVPLVEDAAEALGATYGTHAAGSLGDLGVFSFNGNKIITTSGGGMLVSRNHRWVDHARHLATQAREPEAHYEHHEMGFNYRLSNLLAALGRAQLATLRQRVEGRRRVAERYRRLLADVDGIGFMPVAPYGRSSCWLTVISINEAAFGASRDDVRLHLAASGIESRPAWKPMHMQPLYADAPHCGGAVAERIFATGLCLPSGSSLTESQQCRVAERLLGTPRPSAMAGTA